jgi:hypothetical protein
MLRVLLVPAVLVVALSVLGGLLLAAAVGSQSPVYTVAALSRRMIDDPESLVDRVVVVHGVVDSNVLIVMQDASGTPASAFVLHDASTGAGETAPFLIVGYGRETAMWAGLRRLPIVGSWVPTPQRVVYDRPATYRVRMEVLAGSCRVACSLGLDLVGGAAP